ncbi:hypothetical protein D9M70_372460 [compost metagenome]
MGDAALAIPACLFDAVEGFAHRAIADGMHVHQPASGVGGADQFAEVLRVDQQFAALVRVFVGLEHGGGLRRYFRHAVGEDLDARQGQVGHALELLAHLVEGVQVGRKTLRVGHQQGRDMGGQLALLGQRLVSG